MGSQSLVHEPTSANNNKPVCAVCDDDELAVLEISKLRRSFCPKCHHCQRIDLPTFDYRTYAMGTTGTHPERLKSQAAFLGPYLKANSSVLEIGCAAGHLANTLKAFQSFRRYDGIELSPAHKEAAKVMDQVFDTPLTTLLDKDLIRHNYDVVISSHCLEHLENLHQEIQAIGRVLSSSGTIFIEVPNDSGNICLPFDDNRAHIQFFCASSLTRLLSKHNFKVFKTETDAWHDARYSDCLRVLARSFFLPDTKQSTILSDHSLLAQVDKVIVWGAGKLAEEMLAHFFDLSRIAFFVDSDTNKHGSLCLGLPVLPIEILSEKAGHVVLINSLEFEEPIRRQINERFVGSVGSVIAISELLSPVTQYKKPRTHVSKSGD